MAGIYIRSPSPLITLLPLTLIFIPTPPHPYPQPTLALNPPSPSFSTHPRPKPTLALSQHTAWQAAAQLGKLLGRSNMLGNPIGLIHTMVFVYDSNFSPNPTSTPNPDY